MGADERFRRAKSARERNEFDGQLAAAVRSGDERAFPADQFGLTVRPGTLVMHFPQTPAPPVCTVTDVQPVLDPRAPAGALRVRLVHDILVPAGMPNPHLLVVGEAPEEKPAAAAPVEPEEDRSKKESASAATAGPRLVLTDVQ